MQGSGAPADTAKIRLEPWGTADFGLLRRCVGDPAMMSHLGGPESPERSAERQARYERAGSRQYKIVDEVTGDGAGWVGYWERDWNGDQVYEIGWAVLPAFRRRGIAGSATREAIAVARAERARRFLHAYPGVGNAPSNAVCRKLGFTLLGATPFEYPEGRLMQCNDWRLELFPGEGPQSRTAPMTPS